MAERKRVVRKTAARKSGVRRTGRKKNNGRGLLWPILFFVVALIGAAYFAAGPEPVTTASVQKGAPTAVEQMKEKLSAAENKVENLVTGKSESKPAEGRGKASQKADSTKAAGTTSAAASSSSAAGEPSVSISSSAPATNPVAPVPASVKGRLAVVIDDAGRDLDSQRVYENMGIPLTLAVMPNQVHTSEASSEWAAAGLPVIIHQPMESVSGSGMEPIVLLTSMTDEEKRNMLSNSFHQIPQAVGMNNHQGSKATTDRHTMDIVMNELHHRGLFFLDSATNTTTAADSAAAAYGVPYARNELFVDNSTDVEEIKAMIRKGARMAAGGSAIIIGHCRPHTAEAFRQIVPELKAEGIQFIYVSQLTH